MYQPNESTRGIGIPPITGSSSEQSSKKYSMLISVDTTQLDETIAKLEQINKLVESVGKGIKAINVNAEWTEEQSKSMIANANKAIRRTSAMY